MSPFKEPQPRKNSVEKDAEKAIGGVWPPYVREVGQANWVEEKAQADIAEAYGHAPIQTTSSLDVTVRKAALEAACALQGNQPGAQFWANIGTLEEYLRHGTKPS